MSDTEIIIVDNGSTVKSDVWEKRSDHYIRFEENKGISYGWNAGLKASKGQYKVVLGDDVIVHTGFLEALQEAMDMPSAGVANVHVQHLPHGVGILEDYKWYSGACFMLTKNTIKKVGYFDENIWPANWEDTDYWLRTYKAKLKLYKNHHFSVQHKEGQTVHAKDISGYFQKNKDYVVKKHGFDPTLIFYGDMPMPY